MDREIESYTQVYKTYVNELYSYGMSLGFPEDLCMDAIHDVFWKLFVDRKKMQRIKNLRFYLFRSVKNRLLDVKKQVGRMSYSGDEKHTFLADVTLVDDALIETEERHRIEARVKNLLEKLTPTQREAVYLRYMQEMQYDEIAQILQITPESARKLVYRALERLRHTDTGIIGFLIFLQLLQNTRIG